MQSQAQTDSDRYAAALSQIAAIVEASESDPAVMRQMLVQIANIASAAIF